MRGAYNHATWELLSRKAPGARPEAWYSVVEHDIVEQGVTFAWEVLEVYSGPPTVAFKWRHWGKMMADYVGFNE